MQKEAEQVGERVCLEGRWGLNKRGVENRAVEFFLEKRRVGGVKGEGGVSLGEAM